MRTVQYEHASTAACQNLQFKSEPRPTYTSGMHPCGEVWRGGYFVLGHDNNRDCSFHVTSRQRQKESPYLPPLKGRYFRFHDCDSGQIMGPSIPGRR